MRLETNWYRKRDAFTHKETYTYNTVSACKSTSNERDSCDVRRIDTEKDVFIRKETYSYEKKRIHTIQWARARVDQMRRIYATWDELTRKKRYSYGQRRIHTKRDVLIRLCEWEEGCAGRTGCAGAHTGQKRNRYSTCTQTKDIFIRLSEWVQENFKWDVFVRKFVRNETPVHTKRRFHTTQ